MTYKELQDLVCRAYKPAKVTLAANVGISLPRVMNHAVQHFWIYQVPETDDMREIRRQLISLEENGCFDVEK